MPRSFALAEQLSGLTQDRCADTLSSVPDEMLPTDLAPGAAACKMSNFRPVRQICPLGQGELCLERTVWQTALQCEMVTLLLFLTRLERSP